MINTMVINSHLSEPVATLYLIQFIKEKNYFHLKLIPREQFHSEHEYGKLEESQWIFDFM